MAIKPEGSARFGAAQCSAKLLARIQSYLGNGGLFNPEMMEHDKVRDLVMDCRDKIERLTFLLELTRHYRIGHKVPMSWFIMRDEEIGNPGVISPNDQAQRPRSPDAEQT